MTGSHMPEAVGSPSSRILCVECAARLFVIWSCGGRWTMCPRCDASWCRIPDIDANVRVGPPAMLRVEGTRP